MHAAREPFFYTVNVPDSELTVESFRKKNGVRSWIEPQRQSYLRPVAPLGKNRSALGVSFHSIKPPAPVIELLPGGNPVFRPLQRYLERKTSLEINGKNFLTCASNVFYLRVFPNWDEPRQMTSSLELLLATKLLFLVHPCVKLLLKEDFRMSSLL